MIEFKIINDPDKIKSGEVLSLLKNDILGERLFPGADRGIHGKFILLWSVSH